MPRLPALLLALGCCGVAAAAPSVSLVEPPDRFFQAGTHLDVAATVSGGAERLRLRLLVDGQLVEEKVASAGTIHFQVARDADDPLALVQVCLVRGAKELSCASARAAGMREFDLVRQTLEEMNEIDLAIERCSRLRLGFFRVPESLEELVPDFLPQVPLTSPLGTPYNYVADDTHYTLRAALPGAGEILLEDGAFTRLPAGALTHREAARLTRQQLLELSLGFEVYWIDFSHYPADLEELVPVYLRRLHLVDPYGNPYAVSLQPETYALTGFGRDGLPGGGGFAADTVVVPDRHVAATTPYRGRHEYARLTLQEMQEIAGLLAHHQSWHGHWPATLSQLVTLRPMNFEDFCGNPYHYEVQDAGLGHTRYVLRAYGCDGVPNTDVEEGWLYYFSASDEGYSSAPRPGWPWPGLFD